MLTGREEDGGWKEAAQCVVVVIYREAMRASMAAGNRAKDTELLAGVKSDEK